MSSSSDNEIPYQPKRLFVFGLAFIAFAIVACQVVAGIDRVEKVAQGTGTDGGSTTSSSGTSGTSSGTSGEPDPNDPCKHVVAPLLPKKDDDVETQLPGFYLALKNVNLTAKEGELPAGVDLDGVCTCDKRAGTANAGASSCKAKPKQSSDCDLDGGIDNVGTKLFTTFAPDNFDINADANGALNEGKRGLLLYITKYNGKPNDADIVVGAMITSGIVDGSGCQTDTGGAKSPPGWCGKDLWTHQQTAVRIGTKEPLNSGNGYVSNGTLVFRTENPIKMFFAGAQITFGAPITMGKISKDKNNNWQLTEASLSGRIPVNELLAATGYFPDPGGGPNGLCNAAYFNAAVKPVLCNSVDISSSLNLDFKEATCDAVSTAIKFEAGQADVGDEFTEVTDDNPCATSKVSPSLYTCP